MSPRRAGSILAASAAAAALLVGAPAATAATSTITGRIQPKRGKPGTPLKLSVRFTTEGDAGEQSATLRRVVVQLPPNAVHNAKLFPTCTAAQINAKKSLRACPAKSLVGRGRLRADVPNAEVWNVPADVTFFNGNRAGNRITIHVLAIRPVPINLAFDASLVRTKGRYGYKLTADIPEELQEIYPTWYPQVRWMESTFNQTIVVRGKKRGYIEAKKCPKSGRVPLAGRFDFRQGTSTSSQGWITCKR